MSELAPAINPGVIHPRGDARRIAALLLLGTFLTFAPAVSNDFINVDDNLYVTENRVVTRGLTLDGITWAFTGFRVVNYHPITWLTHMADVELFGPSAGGHHLTSVLLHSINAALLFTLLSRATGSVLRSAFAAALFAVHPLRVESVAWVAERKDVLSTFFGLMSLLAYARYTRERSGRAYAWTVLWFTLGLLSKPMIVTLPCVMLLMDYWPLRRAASMRGLFRLVPEKLPMLALSAAASVVTFLAQREGGAIRAVAAFPLDRRIANAFVAYGRYLGKTFWPDDLLIFYPYPPALAAIHVAGAVALLIAITAAALVLARRQPYFIVGWLWFLGTLVPVIGIIQVGRQAMADRYTYLPHIGLFVAMSWGLADLAATLRVPRQALRIGAAAIFIALALTTILHIGRWRDSSTLFAYVRRVDPHNPMGRHQLANELARQSPPNLDAAEAEYRAVIAALPEDAMAHLNLGKIQQRRGRLDLAEPWYREAIRLKPSLAQAHLTLGSLLAHQGRYAEAERSLRDALAREPDWAMAHYHLGVVLRQQGRLDEARRHFEGALSLQPSLDDARRALDQLRPDVATRPAAATTTTTTFGPAPPPL